MNCYDIGTIQAYIDGELSLKEMKEISDHVDKCGSCQRLFQELSDLNEKEQQLINNNDLIQINTNDAWAKFQSNNIQNNKSKNRGVLNMKKIGYVAAAAIILAVSAPKLKVIADNIISEYFTKSVLEDKIINEGYREANGDYWDMTKNGQFFPINKSITNNNLTIHFTELYVADSRISVNYEILDKNGNLVDFSKKSVNDSVLTAKDNPPIKLLSGGVAITENIGIREVGNPNDNSTNLTFIIVDDTFKNKQPVSINVSVDKIGDVSGKWELNIPIDVSHLSTEKPIVAVDPSEKTIEEPVPTNVNLIFPDLSGYEKEDFGGDAVGYSNNDIMIISSKRVAPKEEVDQFLLDVKNKVNSKFIDTTDKKIKMDVEYISILDKPAVKVTRLDKDGNSYLSFVLFYIDNEMYSIQGTGAVSKLKDIDTNLAKIYTQIKLK